MGSFFDRTLNKIFKCFQFLVFDLAPVFKLTGISLNLGAIKAYLSKLTSPRALGILYDAHQERMKISSMLLPKTSNSSVARKVFSTSISKSYILIKNLAILREDLISME